MSRKRRHNGEGTITQRPGGTWQGRISYIDATTGQHKRVSVDASTAAAVRAKMKAVRDRLEAGSPPKDAARTVGDWFKHWRATTLAASDRAESTRALYGRLSRTRLEPAPFGQTALDKLRPSDVEALVLALRAKGLGGSTIRSTYTVLRAGLDGAVRDGLLARNPAALVKRPSVQRREARHLPAADVAVVLNAAEASRYYPALALIASTGLSKGETLALRWDRVDLDAGTLKVAATLSRIDGHLVIGPPKTERRRREVPLHPAIVTMLRKHRLAQRRERLAAANVWQNTNLVFTTETGGPVDPRNFLRVIQAAAKKAALTKVGVHTLRHSAAVAMLESGTHIKAVADILGHSSIAITGDVYGHTSDTAARAAIGALGAALGL